MPLKAAALVAGAQWIDRVDGGHHLHAILSLRAGNKSITRQNEFPRHVLLVKTQSPAPGVCLYNLEPAILQFLGKERQQRTIVIHN